MGDPVNPTDQGPNEQSIIASGMTMEEWHEKHPGQALGPAPEDIGQVTTDPPDGSELSVEESQEAAELVFPSTKTEPEHNSLEGGNKSLDEPPHPAADPKNPSFQPEFTEPLGPNESVNTEESDEEGDEYDEEEGAHDHSHQGLTSHAQLNDYITENNLIAPDDWNNKTVADKKAWLDTQPAR